MGISFQWQLGVLTGVELRTVGQTHCLTEQVTNHVGEVAVFFIGPGFERRDEPVRHADGNAFHVGRGLTEVRRVGKEKVGEHPIFF